MSEMISEQDAAARKAEHPDVTPQLANKKWFFRNFASVSAALTFVNTAPVQAAGEISASARNDGTVGLFYFSTTA